VGRRAGCLPSSGCDKISLELKTASPSSLTCFDGGSNFR
jgi:hypothetical protein